MAGSRGAVGRNSDFEATVTVESTPVDQQILLACQRGVLESMNQTLTAQIGLMLNMKANVSEVLNVLVEHLCKLLSLIEPEQGDYPGVDT